MVLSDNEIQRIAWRLVLDGAESYAEDWFDEEGEFDSDDETAIIDTMFRIIDYLRENTEKLFTGEVSGFVVTGYE